MDNYSPWGSLAKTPDLEVLFADLPDDYGWYDPDRHVIVLDKQQSRRQMRCTLAHELEHARRGDECPPEMSPILATRQEIAVSTAAARRLITIEKLIDGLLWSQDEGELSEQLDVDEDTLRIRLLTLTPAEHALIDERLWVAEGRIA